MADYNLSVGADTGAALPSVSALTQKLLDAGRAADAIVTKLGNVTSAAASAASAAAQSLSRISASGGGATASPQAAAAANAAAAATRSQTAALNANVAAVNLATTASTRSAAASRAATTAAVQSTTAVRANTVAAQRQAQATQSSVTASRSNTAAMQSNTAAVTALSGNIQTLIANIDRLSGSQNRNSQNTGRQSSMFASMRGAIAGLILSYIGLNAAINEVSAIKNATLQMDQFNRSAKFIAGSVRGGAEEMAFLRRESDRLGIVMPSVTQEYFNLSVALKGTKLEGQATRDIFLGVAEAGTVLGLSQERMKLVMAGVVQIASKGVVSMEEIRQQVGESLPIALGAAARAYGVTKERMIEMIATGEVMSEDFLPKWSAQMRKDVAEGTEEATRSAQASFARLENSAFELRDSFGDAVVPVLLEMQKTLIEVFKDDQIKTFVGVIGTTLVLAFKALAEIVKFATDHFDSLVIAATAFALLNVPATIGAITISMGSMAVATGTATAALARFNAFLMANPFVLILAAIIAVNEATKMWGESSVAAIRAAVASTEDLQESWRKTEEAIKSADEAQVKARQQAIESQQEMAKAQLAALDEQAKKLRESPMTVTTSVIGSNLGNSSPVRTELTEEGKQLLEVNKQRGELSALIKQNDAQLKALTKTMSTGTVETEEYGKKVKALIDNLTAKKAGLQATREELGMMGEPMANAAADAASLGRAIEKLTKLGIDKDSGAGKQVIALEQAIGRMNAQVKTFNKGPGLSERIDDQTESLLRAAKAYDLSVEAGDAAIDMMKEEISVRRQAKTSDEGVIKALMEQVRIKKEAEKFAVGAKQIAITTRTITEINKVTAAYKVSIQTGKDMERQLEQERISRERVAAAAADQKEEVDGLTRSEYLAIEASKAAILGADVALETANLQELITTLKTAPDAYEQVLHAQEKKAAKSEMLKDLSEQERLAMEPLIDTLLELRDAYQPEVEIAMEQRNLDVLIKQSEVRREDFATFEQYKLALEEVTFEMELQARLRTMVGADPGELARMEGILRKQREINKTLEAKNVETAWQAAISSIGDTLEKELVSSAEQAIDKWVEFGDSWIANLGEKLVEQFLSQAVQAAAASLFSGGGGNGGGFWSNVIGAFGGNGGGGGGGGGGGWGTWISTAVSAYKAWQSGGSAWGAIKGIFTGGGTQVATTAASAPPYYLANGTTYAAGTGGAGGVSASTGTAMGAGATAFAVLGVAGLIIAAFKLYLDKKEAKEFKDVGQTFSFDYRRDNEPNKPYTGPLNPRGAGGGGGPGGPQTGQNAGFNLLGGRGDDNDSGGRGNRDIGFEILGQRSRAVPIADLNVPTIKTGGSLEKVVGQEEIEKLRKFIEDSTIGLVKSLGGVVTGLKSFTFNIRNDGKEFKATVDGVSKNFKTLDEALKYGIAEMLAGGTFEGLTANIKSVLEKANTIGLDGLQEALALAQEADDALAKRTGKVSESLSLFERQTLELKATLEPTIARMQELGFTHESIAAWEEVRIQQLKDQQAIQGGEAFTSLFSSLAQVSAAAAGDLGLVAQYEEALGQIRIAQLRMQADELRALGYLTAETMNLLDDYISRLQAGDVGRVVSSGSGYFNGGRSGVSTPDNSAQEAATRDKAIADFRHEASMAALSLSGITEQAVAMVDALKKIDDAVAAAKELGLAEDELTAYRRDQLELLKRDLLADDRVTVRRARAGDFAADFDALVQETQGKFEAAVQIAMQEAALLGTTWQEQFAAMGDVITEAAKKNFTDLINQGLATDDPAALRQIVDLLNNLDSAEIPYGVRQAIEAIPDLGARVQEALARVRDGLMDSVREYLDMSQGIGEHQRTLIDMQKQFDAVRKGLGDLYGENPADPLADAMQNTTETLTDSMVEPLERLQSVLRETGDQIDQLTTSLGGDKGLTAATSTLDTVTGGAQRRVDSLADTSGDYERALAELEAAQRLATQQLGINFLGSLKELGLNLPADEVRALAVAEFNLAKVRAISSLLALQEAGAFEGLDIDIARILEDLTNLKFENSTYNPQQQNQGDPGDSPGDSLQSEIDDTKKMLADLIKEWRERGIAQVILDARRMREQYDEALAAANKYRLATGELTAAYQHAVRVFVNDQLKVYEEAGINRTVLALRDLVSHFDDLQEAFRTLGASSGDMARLAKARVMALDDFWRQATQPLKDILTEMKAQDPRTTNQERFLAAQRRFRELSARAAAGDVGALEELAAATQDYRSQAGAFLGQGGGSLRIFDEITRALEGITGFNPLTGDALPDKIDLTNDILSDILIALGGSPIRIPPGTGIASPVDTRTTKPGRLNPSSPAGPTDLPVRLGSQQNERGGEIIDVGLGSRVNGTPAAPDAHERNEDRRVERLEKGLADLREAQTRGAQQVAVTNVATGSVAEQQLRMMEMMLIEFQALRKAVENNTPRAGR
jgi:tape measure domain-containing protein